MVLAHTRRMYSVVRTSLSAVSMHCSRYRHRKIQMPPFAPGKFIHTSRHSCNDKKPSTDLKLYSFESIETKEKEAFLDILHMYEQQEPTRRSHVEFIKAAMCYMDEFGVSEDLDTYKKLIDIMPKGRFIASSPLSADMMYFPKQQQCIIDLLEKMETNGVIPDYETQQMLLNIFGQFGIPLRKFWRMMYWMPKFRNLNPWPTPRPVPNDPMILARLAIEKISSVDVQTEVTIFKTEDVEHSVDKTWIVSAMSPEQQSLLKEHPKNEACYVEGPHLVWVAHQSIHYFILRAEPAAPPKEDDIDEDDVTKIKIAFWDDPKNTVGRIRSVHEQEDATIYSVCATGTSSKDSLLSWIRCLQLKNPVLEKIPVLFTFMSQTDDAKVITSGKPPVNEKHRKVYRIGDN